MRNIAWLTSRMWEQFCFTTKDAGSGIFLLSDGRSRCWVIRWLFLPGVPTAIWTKDQKPLYVSLSSLFGRPSSHSERPIVIMRDYRPEHWNAALITSLRFRNLGFCFKSPGNHSAMIQDAVTIEIPVIWRLNKDQRPRPEVTTWKTTYDSGLPAREPTKVTTGKNEAHQVGYHPDPIL